MALDHGSSTAKLEPLKREEQNQEARKVLDKVDAFSLDCTLSVVPPYP